MKRELTGNALDSTTLNLFHASAQFDLPLQVEGFFRDRLRALEQLVNELCSFGNRQREAFRCERVLGSPGESLARR